MKLGLINSAWVQAGRPTVYGLQMTKEIGFDTVDIFADPLEIDVRERRLIKDECDRLELPIVSLACVAVGLIDPGNPIRQFHRRRVEAYLDLAYEYRARNVLLVIGEYIWNREVIPPAEQWGWAVENTRQLGQRAADLGLEIVVELEPFPLSLVNSVETMVRFLDDVDLPQVKANIDVSHLVFVACCPRRAAASGWSRWTCPLVGLRRQGAWRPAAGPRRRSLRALSARDQRSAHRRRRVDRTGIRSAAGSDCPLGARGLRSEQPPAARRRIAMRTL